MEEISKDQLEECIVRLQRELERKDLNYLRLERERIHKLSKITERQLEEAKAECKNLDKEIEDIEKQHQVELKVYKQKMKHLLCEHQKTISELKVDGLTSTDAVQKEQARLETTLQDVQELNVENLVKKQLNELKGKQKEKDLPYYLRDNKHFKDVLTVIEKETEILEKKYTRHSKYSIQNKRSNIKAKAKQLADLKRDCAVLEQKASQNVEKAQHNADLRKMRLSKGLEAVTESLEKTQAQLSSVLSASNMDQSALVRATNNIEEDIISSKDCIKDLLDIKAKISKARKELLLTHEAQQRALGVPTEKLCGKLFKSKD
ncbi:hypothetical protein PAMA_018788 [Pampus argenteus]